MNIAPTYLFEANEKPSLPLHSVPLIEATEHSLAGYGCLVDHPDRQGRVHARVSCDIGREFGVYLSVPLQP